MEDQVDNVFGMADYLAALVQAREGFRLVANYATRRCTNVGFWYVPSRLRGQAEDERWWGRMEKVAPRIKEGMIRDGSLMIGYQPIGARGLRNFFRMVLHGTPRPTREDMRFVVEEIERIGEQIDIDA